MSAIVQQTDADTLRYLHNDLAKSFELAKDLPLDPALRSEADAISAAHLTRIDQLLPAWMEEERALESADGHTHRSEELFYALWAGQLNELALWQVEPGDPAYERATLDVLKSAPRICEHIDTNYEEFSRRIERIQQMPAAQRGAALATERQLLARWGQPRTDVPAWPEPAPQNAAMALIQHRQPKASAARAAAPAGERTAGPGNGLCGHAPGRAVRIAAMVVAGKPAPRRDAGRRTE
jgi:hypothetical protein